MHIFVFNARGELFLQRRSQWKDMHPRRWDSSAAGHVNAGFDYAETADEAWGIISRFYDLAGEPPA